MVRILDRKLSKGTLTHYIGQSFIAAFILYLSLRLPVLGEEIVLVAAVGSTAFVVFTMPKSKTSTPRRAFGSHVLCGLIGFGFSSVYPSILSFELAVSFALGIAILSMVSLWFEHPPAGGTVIFFVLNPNVIAFISMLLLVSMLVTISMILRPYLIDLV